MTPANISLTEFLALQPHLSFVKPSSLEDLMLLGVLLLSLCVFGTVGWIQISTPDDDEALLPSISSTSIPRFITNLQFAAFASRLIDYGWTKFRDQAFRISRGDQDVIILPGDLLEELARLPVTVASPHGALEKDLLGPYTGLDIILDSRMHRAIVQRKLTPRLGLLTPSLEAEIKDAIEEYFPPCRDWIEFQPYHILAKVAARLASRALVGEQFCRSEAWLDIAVNYTENLMAVFRTIVLLRLFPNWTHPFIYRLLPSYWRGRKHMENARLLLNPCLEELLKKNDSGEWTPRDTPEEFTVLHWLADTAKGRDRDASTLSQVEVLLALASVHTTLLRMINVLYDLTANKEYIDDLRAELVDLQVHQGHCWPPTSYDQLHKLDSVLRESQRMSPPTTLGLKRVFKENYVFSNGLHVAAGTYVCLPTYAIENAPENCPNPSVFDGMRSFRLRQQQQLYDNNSNSGESFTFSSIDQTTLNFGYGKHACPGRHFASLILKMLFVRLLTEYEFDFLRGTSRPSNYTIHEFLFCWPWQKILVKQRADKTSVPCPF